ncbi:MAG: pilus assembly protein [Myxococcales bacterium]|nr:pilus assembly protein [Myxococcales bacterium]
MREQRTRRGRGRDNERGIAALEFVLVLPLLVAMLYAGVTFGQAIYARYQLASAANESARACALESTDMATCEQHVRQKIASVAHWCGGGGGDGDAGGSTGSGVQVSVSRRALAGLRHVDAIHIEIHCAFVGSVGRKLLKKHGVTLINLNTSATMPL